MRKSLLFYIQYVHPDTYTHTKQASPKEEQSTKKKLHRWVEKGIYYRHIIQLREQISHSIIHVYREYCWKQGKQDENERNFIDKYVSLPLFSFNVKAVGAEETATTIIKKCITNNCKKEDEMESKRGTEKKNTGKAEEIFPLFSFSNVPMICRSGWHVLLFLLPPCAADERKWNWNRCIKLFTSWVKSLFNGIFIINIVCLRLCFVSTRDRSAVPF